LALSSKRNIIAGKTEKSLVIFKFFVNIAFHVQFFISIFHELSCLSVMTKFKSICVIFLLKHWRTNAKREAKSKKVIALNFILFPNILSLFSWKVKLGSLCAQTLTNERKKQDTKAEYNLCYFFYHNNYY
jgi:hypothetical protein